MAKLNYDGENQNSGCIWAARWVLNGKGQEGNVTLVFPRSLGLTKTHSFDQNFGQVPLSSD